MATDQLAAYIPMDRRLALARGEDLPDRTHGAALFVDISGFTPLTEALARMLGPRRGAEEMTQQINRVYTALVDEVHGRRGSIIGFAGDAMTCWFDGDDGGRALACGLAMQRAMAPFAAVALPDGTTVALAIKVAVAVGPARRFVVGDPAALRMDVLAGETLQRMARGEHHASRGEVLADAVAIANLGARARVAAWRADEESGERFALVAGLDGTSQRDDEDDQAEPWPELPPGALSAEAARSWLLPPVYERLRGGQGEFLAELRSVVPLFLSFEGIDYDGDPDAGARLDAFIRRAQAALNRYEGHLLQITIGDKGSYCYAAFGAPLAHDDDDARAVAAALDLLALDGGDGNGDGESGGVRGLRIGISRGRVRVGAYGGATQRTYGALGDEVNVAARLMGQAAPGQILVSARVADAVAGQFEVAKFGAINLKGKAEPLLVYAARGRRLAPAQRAATGGGRALVGRAAELEQIARIMEAARGGAGQVLRLEGAPGVGKSHLAAEMVERARAAGMRVAIGACQSTTRETAYLPWRQVFRDLLGLDDQQGERDDERTGADASNENARAIARLEAFAAASNAGWAVRLPLLGDLLDLPIPDNSTTAAFEPSLRRAALFDLARETIEALSREQPMLLLLDDVHWMDEVSRELTVMLGRALGESAMLLVLAQRPPLQDEPILPELDALSQHHLLSLDELDAAGVAALVAERLGGDVSPLALALIVREAQGNPFFSEELVDSLRETGQLVERTDGGWELSEALFGALREQGALARVEGDWTLAPGAARASGLGLPDSVEGMVLARMDRLPERAKLTLRVASVIGRVFPLDALALAHPLHPDTQTLAADLATLLARDFARLETPEPRTSYLFKHNVTHEVAYDTLLFAQRRELHHAVALALEQVTPADVAQLARHTYLGEDWERSLRYQAQAGRQAQKLFANHEGIEHFRRALLSADHLPDADTVAPRLALLTDLGELLTATSQYEQAQQQLEQALALADALDDRDARARVCRWFARLHELKGDFTTALDWIQRGIDALAGHTSANVAEALITAGLIYARRGDYASAEQQVEQSRRIGENLGNRAVVARALGLLGIICRVRGDTARALAALEQALILYRQDENIHGQALVHNEIANVDFALGRWTEADAHFRQAREILRQIGDTYHEALASNNLGGIARDQGRLEDAVSYYHTALRSLEQTGGSPYMLSGIHMNLAATYIRGGDIAAARRSLDISEDYIVQAQLKDFLPEFHRLRAEAALRAGGLPTAEAEGRQSLALARELGMTGEEGRTLRVLGEIEQARGDLDVAEASLSRGIALLRESAEAFEEGRGQLALARLLNARGQREGARAALERCIAIFAQLDERLDLEAARALHASLAAST